MWANYRNISLFSKIYDSNSRNHTRKCILIFRQVQASSYQCLFCFQVDGIWSGWSNWTVCSKSCGSGLQYRTRKCQFLPAGAPHAASCVGLPSEQQACNTDLCPGNRSSHPYQLDESTFILRDFRSDFSFYFIFR